MTADTSNGGQKKQDVCVCSGATAGPGVAEGVRGRGLAGEAQRGGGTAGGDGTADAGAEADAAEAGVEMAMCGGRRAGQKMEEEAGAGVGAGAARGVA
jgi:hypothetical protein